MDIRAYTIMSITIAIDIEIQVITRLLKEGSG
jgi:hypothetical protein